MPTVITNTTINSAKAAAKPGARRYDIADARAAGLVLRVSPRGVGWGLRFEVNGKSRRVVLGDVDTWTIAEARALAHRALTMVRERVGIPDDEWVERQKRAAGKIEEATLEQQPMPPRHLFAWTFDEACSAFLEDRAKVLRPETIKDYRAKLKTADLVEMAKTPVPQIQRKDLAKILKAIHDSGRETHAGNVQRVLSAMWSWLEADTQIDRSRVTPGAMRGLRAPERSIGDENDDDAYVPPMSEVARIIAICRSGAVHPTMASAIELLCWTAQRRRTVAVTEIDEFEPAGEVGGLWIIRPRSLKARLRNGKRRPPHVVPLPLRAWAGVMEQLERLRDYDGPYMFPQIRAKRAGDIRTHIDPDSISHALAFMPGVRSTAHGIRRAFATHGETLLGLLRSDTKAILDHGETPASQFVMSARAGRDDVTGQHYSLHDATHRTWPIMRAWVGALEPLIEIEGRKLPPLDDLKAAIAAKRYGDDHGRAAAE